MKLSVIDLGICDYQSSIDDMRNLSEISFKTGQNFMIFCEYEEVLTGKIDPKIDIKFEQTDRGGGLTYHNFGQLVIYFVFNLESELAISKNIKYITDFIEILLNATKNIIKKYQIDSVVKNGSNAGIFIKDYKVASIGLRVSRKIITHGISINLNNNLDGFSKITACNDPNLQFTSLKREIGQEIDIDYFKLQFKDEIESILK